MFFVAAMVSISLKVVLSYKALSEVSIPYNLIQEDGKDKFLKIQASHPVITKVTAAAGGKLAARPAESRAARVARVEYVEQLRVE